MNGHHAFVVRMCIAAALTWLSVAACAQSVAAATPPLPADPWPRSITLSNAAVLVYQPQVTSWDGHRIEFRSALALKPAGAKEETFGVIFATARTDVDKVDRTVVFEDLQVSKSDFPTLPDHGAAFKTELQTRLAGDLRTISLDRLQASLVAAGGKMASIGVDNTPPQIFVSNRPAILVPVDGAPVLKAIAHHARYQRVINTRALIVQDTRGSTYYLHVYDGWLASTSLSGPWSQAFRGPVMEHELTAIATELSASGAVDLLDGGPKAKPKLSLQQMVPTIDVSQGAAELVVFDGQPDFVPVVGTQLLWASNTTSDVLIDIASNHYYLLLAGRWFTSAALSGPWTFVASNALPADFARIPPHSLAGAVLPSVSGTPQAREAVIANSIPQSATVPRKNGPKFTPNFDGPPQYAAVADTSLSYVVNSSEPVIRVDPDAWYAVVAGVWFTAAQVTGPWTVATSVPAVIYTIPPSSPLHYVTYVRIYEATPQYVYAGYTPGYLGVVVEPSGTIVYGTGFAYSPWIGSVWYPGPVTYTVAAAPIYNPYVGFTFGFAVGLATAAWYAPYYGGFYGAYYHPAYWGGYACCASGSANVYGHWGNAAYSGTRSWYAGGGVAGTIVQRQLRQRAHRHVRQHQRREAVQRLDRQRHARLRSHDQRCSRRCRQRRAGQQRQPLHRTTVDGLGRRGSLGQWQHVSACRRHHLGTARVCACGRRIVEQRRHREIGHLVHREPRQQSLCRRQWQRLPQQRKRLGAARIRWLEQRGRRHVLGRSRSAVAQRWRRPVRLILERGRSIRWWRIRRRPIGRLRRRERRQPVRRRRWLGGPIWWRRRGRIRRRRLSRRPALGAKIAAFLDAASRTRVAARSSP